MGFAAALLLTGLTHAAEGDAGLILTIKSAHPATLPDTSIAPNVWLFVQEGQPPGPFVPSGKFTATWEGNVNAELRSEFVFQAELNGELKLEINGKPVYQASGSGAGSAALSKPVQLNKGANALRAVFTSPEKGDAFVRLSWTEKPPYTTPIPLAALTHSAIPELNDGLRRRFGRESFLEYRCFNCHHERFEQSVPELSMDAPSFEGIGARRNYEWMARWILDPRAARASVHMPRMFNSSTAKDDAEAVAAYLSSLKTGGEVSIAEPKIRSKSSNLTETDTPQTEERKPLFETLHCGACHNAPDEAQPDAKKIDLKHVAQKFAPGKLAEFLRAPEAHFAWIRMPNFHLTSKEAAELSESLMSKAAPPEKKEASTEKAILEHGKKLVQENGCLNCHKANLANKFAAPSLAALSADKWSRGCLTAKPSSASRAPEFGFSAEQRDALKAFGQTDRQSLRRHAPAEFAERQTRLLNCLGCHGQPEGFPPLDILGGKLKPEWSAKFIAGEILYKPRAERHPKGEPWLEMRMPAFKSRATLLATGLAAEHGYPPRTPAEGPLNMEFAKLGQKLVGKDGGFSCVSCHGVGNMEAMEVFESEGINLAYSGERLLLPYYRRWLRNPLAIDPQSKMPVYFEDDKSPLTEVLDGDADKQIDAIWQYIRLGTKMPPPNAAAQ